MMYEMLVGEQPFRGEQPVQIAYQHANDSVPAPSLKNPEVPSALDDLTLWATARDPEQRPRDARAMLDQLFETQHLIRDGRSGTGPQATTVLPAAATTRLAPVPARPVRDRPRTAAVPVGAPTRLAIAAARAKRRGTWAFVAVLVAGLLAAGTGWWLGSGPGGPAHAASSPTVALAGDTVRSVPVPAVRGAGTTAASRLLHTAGFRLGPALHVASARPAGTVVRLADAQGTALPGVASVPARTVLRLVVSTGPATG
jgi:serine/threonine-protein kinase